jgi:hypothetical protein
MVTLNTDVDMLRLLGAEGPAPEMAEKMMLFGQFIGSWDLDLVAYPPGEDGSRYAGEWHFGCVLDGHGIQDVLIAWPVAAPRGNSLQGGKGSTLRVYDPGLDAWWICWMGPDDREFSTLLARSVGVRSMDLDRYGDPDVRAQRSLRPLCGRASTGHVGRDESVSARQTPDSSYEELCCQ